jgi:hypothetical protein
VLGWEFFVTRRVSTTTDRPSVNAPLLATWQASFRGIEWLEDLVQIGTASNLGGDGYPKRFALPAGVLTEVLAHGPPKHDSPPIIGDDFFVPRGWTGHERIDLPALKAIDPHESLLVEAWDQS